MEIEDFCRRCAANYEAGNDQPCAFCQGLGISWKGVPEIDYLRQSLAAAQARIEKLERMLIWCLDQGARNVRNRSLVFADLVPVEHAGTTVSVLAAVEKAMEK